jgi:hypothetical protein
MFMTQLIDEDRQPHVVVLASLMASLLIDTPLFPVTRPQHKETVGAGVRLNLCHRILLVLLLAICRYVDRLYRLFCVAFLSFPS